MDGNVPRGAEVLLDYIGGLETARKGATPYNTVSGHLDEKGKLPKPVTTPQTSCCSCSVRP